MRLGRLVFWLRSPLVGRVIPADEYARVKAWQEFVDRHGDARHKNTLYLDAGGEMVTVDRGVVTSVT